MTKLIDKSRPKGSREPEPNLCLTIWHFIDAPQAYGQLSRHGGDEDWVLLCPARAAEVSYWPSSLMEVISGQETSYLSGFGHIDRHVLANGDIVVIFAHA